MADSGVTEKACIEIANRMILACQLPTPRIQTLREIGSPIYIHLFHALCGYIPEGVNEYPLTREEDECNIKLILNAFSADILRIRLTHIKASDVAKLDPLSVFNLLEIFEAYYRHGTASSTDSSSSVRSIHGSSSDVSIQTGTSQLSSPLESPSITASESTPPESDRRCNFLLPIRSYCHTQQKSFPEERVPQHLTNVCLQQDEIGQPLSYPIVIRKSVELNRPQRSQTHENPNVDERIDDEQSSLSYARTGQACPSEESSSKQKPEPLSTVRSHSVASSISDKTTESVSRDSRCHYTSEIMPIEREAYFTVVHKHRAYSPEMREQETVPKTVHFQPTTSGFQKTAETDLCRKCKAMLQKENIHDDRCRRNQKENVADKFSGSGFYTVHPREKVYPVKGEINLTDHVEKTDKGFKKKLKDVSQASILHRCPCRKELHQWDECCRKSKNDQKKIGDTGGSKIGTKIGGSYPPESPSSSSSFDSDLYIQQNLGDNLRKETQTSPVTQRELKFIRVLQPSKRVHFIENQSPSKCYLDPKGFSREKKFKETFTGKVSPQNGTLRSGEVIDRRHSDSIKPLPLWKNQLVQCAETYGFTAGKKFKGTQQPCNAKDVPLRNSFQQDIIPRSERLAISDENDATTRCMNSLTRNSRLIMDNTTAAFSDRALMRQLQLQNLMLRDLEANHRRTLNQFKEQRRRQIQNALRGNPVQTMRVKHMYEGLLETKSRTFRNVTVQESVCVVNLMNDIYREGVSDVENQIMSMCRHSKQDAGKIVADRQNKLQSIYDYYWTQMNMLREKIESEKKNAEEQDKVLDQLLYDFKRTLRNTVKNMQEQIT